MEETKPSRINSVMAKFKALKKPYQIAIVVGIVAVIALIFLMSPPKTPFDGLKDHPDLVTVRARYGKENDINKNTLIYNDYKWLGYNGKLSITFEKTGYSGTDNDWHVWYAEWWALEDVDTSNAFKKACKALNKKFGKGEKEDTTMVWEDKYGNEYTLHSRYHFSLDFHN